MQVPQTFYNTIPSEETAIFSPLELNLSLGSFSSTFRISIPKDFPPGDYTLTPILKKTAFPLIYTKMNSITLKVSEIDKTHKIDSPVANTPVTPPNLTNQPNLGLKYAPKHGLIPVKVVFSPNIDVNGETLPFLVYTESLPDSTLLVDFYFKTDFPFLRPIKNRIRIDRNRPSDFLFLGFLNSQDYFKEPSKTSILHAFVVF